MGQMFKSATEACIGQSSTHILTREKKNYNIVKNVHTKVDAKKVTRIIICILVLRKTTSFLNYDIHRFTANQSSGSLNNYRKSKHYIYIKHRIKWTNFKFG